MSEILYDYTNKRKYYRLNNPVKITLEGREYTTLDWSVSALKISGYSGLLEVNEKTTAEIEINFQGFTVKFSQDVQVLRYEPKTGSIVLEYVETSPRNREILSYFSRGLITGEFQAFEDIIRHIDIPLSEEYIVDNFEAEAVPAAPKRWVSYLSYLLLGVLVAVYVFNLVYSRGYLMPVESAVVASATEVISSPVQGHISDIYAEEGSDIAFGQPLFSVVSPELQRELEDKRIELLKNTALLKERKTQLANGFQYEKLSYLEEELEKKRLLLEKKLVSKPEVDELYGKIIETRQELAILQAETQRLEEIIAINRKDFLYSEELNALNTVKAPFDGVLEEVTAFGGKYVDEDAPVLLVRPKSENRYIEAYLNDKQPHRLAINARVHIELPLYGVKTRGRLTGMQKDGDSIVAEITPDSPEVLKGVKPGTPAKISFVKKSFLGQGKGNNE